MASSHDVSFGQFAVEEDFFLIVGRSVGGGITTLRPSSLGSFAWGGCLAR